MKNDVSIEDQFSKWDSLNKVGSELTATVFRYIRDKNKVSVTVKISKDSKFENDWKVYNQQLSKYFTAIQCSNVELPVPKRLFFFRHRTGKFVNVQYEDIGFWVHTNLFF